MRKSALTLLAVLLAMLARPLQLPAASCILSNAPSQEACKPKCCANKSCCAMSKKSSAPVSPPLVKPGDVGQQLLIAFVPIALIDSIAESDFTQPPGVAIAVRAHSPPPLVTSCIRLI